MTTLSIDLTTPLRDASDALDRALATLIPRRELRADLLAAVLRTLTEAASDPFAPRSLPIELGRDPEFGTVEIRIRRGRQVDTWMCACG